jgi:group I intron endonuclease
MTDDTEPQPPAPVTPRKKIGGVYAIRNTVSGRVYVGSSYNIKDRWASHRHLLRQGKHHAVTLQRSWTKHGPDAFVFEILEVVDDTNQLFTREQYWMDLLGAASPTKGFNGYPIAGGPRGHKASPETRARMSTAKKGKPLRPFSEAHKEAIRRARMGTKASDESKAKQSAIRKGRPLGPFSESHKQALSRSMAGIRKGKNLAPEHARKVRAVLAARNATPEMRRATAIRNATPEHKRAVARGIAKKKRDHRQMELPV